MEKSRVVFAVPDELSAAAFGVQVKIFVGQVGIRIPNLLPRAGSRGWASTVTLDRSGDNGVDLAIDLGNLLAG
jgi:hypothetical protein